MKDIKRAALHSLGCRVNSYETQAMEEALSNEGYEIVPFDSPAQVYVINTCSVTAVSDKKSRQMIRRARRLSESAIVIACGCFTENSKNVTELKSLGCDIVLGNNHKGSLISEIENFKSTGEYISRFSDIQNRETAFEEMALEFPREHVRGFIKIQDGCDRYCNYCIIPYVRGKSRSRDPGQILEEAKSFGSKGCREIVFSAINLGDYSHGDTGLFDLIKGVNEIPDISRIRLGSLEPDVFNREFVEKIKTTQKLCPHFHFSLQSACDKTLKAMNRRYDFSAVLRAVELLRENFDNPAICADVIAGYPGETEEDFLECLNNIKALKLTQLHVFPYSKREGTKAAQSPHQLSKAIKDERAGRLLALSHENEVEFMEGLVDKERYVLFEESQTVEGETMYFGYTPEYVRVGVKSDKNLQGKIQKTLLNSLYKPALGEGLPLLLSGDIIE